MYTARNKIIANCKHGISSLLNDNNTEQNIQYSGCSPQGSQKEHWWLHHNPWGEKVKGHLLNSRVHCATIVKQKNTTQRHKSISMSRLANRKQDVRNLWQGQHFLVHSKAELGYELTKSSNKSGKIACAHCKNRSNNHSNRVEHASSYYITKMSTWLLCRLRADIYNNFYLIAPHINQISD